MSRYFILTSLRKYNIGEGKNEANQNGNVLLAMQEKGTADFKIFTKVRFFL